MSVRNGDRAEGRLQVLDKARCLKEYNKRTEKTKMDESIYMRLQIAEAQNAYLKQRNAKLNANLEYLSMMTDVEIPDEEEEHDEPLE